MKEYSFKINGKQYDVTVESVEGKNAQVVVNGAAYSVEIEKGAAEAPAAAPVAAPAPQAAPAQTSPAPAAPAAPVNGTVVLDAPAEPEPQVPLAEGEPVIAEPEVLPGSDESGFVSAEPKAPEKASPVVAAIIILAGLAAGFSIAFFIL